MVTFCLLSQCRNLRRSKTCSSDFSKSHIKKGYHLFMCKVYINTFCTLLHVYFWQWWDHMLNSCACLVTYTSPRYCDCMVQLKKLQYTKWKSPKRASLVITVLIVYYGIWVVTRLLLAGEGYFFLHYSPPQNPSRVTLRRDKIWGGRPMDGGDIVRVMVTPHQTNLKFCCRTMGYTDRHMWKR